MLYLITPTGDRLLQFNLCVEMMSEQSYGGQVTWVIIDDGIKNVPTPNVKNWTIIHKILPIEIGNTQSRNLLAGLGCCDPTKKILVIEDDDYYHYDWLKLMNNKLDNYSLVGSTKAQYYNLPTLTYRHFKNKKHSSLCSTGIHGKEPYNLFVDICKHQPRFIDMHLWGSYQGSTHLFCETAPGLKNGYVVGIKGLPGKRGLGSGHRGLKGRDDVQNSLLINWVGQKWAKIYLDIRKNL